ncbi:MAG: glycosyltransferase family 2 protein [Candidatus Berkelbacteria bacterium]|nr:glycosyltransferase family 2 protein [Candidatus Berkelbacteria bacterium]
MKKILLSVVMPIYNREGFLPKVIESYQNQSFSDFEMILVDDKSTDNSFQICQNFSKIDNRIKCFQLKKNSGVAVARDFGNKKASGEIIVIADSDDFAYENRLKIINSHFIANPDSDIFYTNLDIHYLNSGEKKTRFFQPYVKELLYNINYIPNASSSYKRKCYFEVAGYDPKQKIGEDYDLWLQFSDKNFKFGFDKRSTVLVTMHSKSIRGQSQDVHQSYIERVWKKHGSTGANLEIVKKLAKKKTYEFFSQPAKLELWFKISA